MIKSHSIVKKIHSEVQCLNQWIICVWVSESSSHNRNEIHSEDQCLSQRIFLVMIDICLAALYLNEGIVQMVMTEIHSAARCLTQWIVSVTTSYFESVNRSVFCVWWVISLRLVNQSTSVYTLGVCVGSDVKIIILNTNMQAYNTMTAIIIAYFYICSRCPLFML